MARILAVGVAVLDIILDVEHYPLENSENRATHCQQRSGGNALNTLNVLQQLGHACHWSGTLASDASARTIEHTMQSQNIDYRLSQIIPDSITPTSYILRNSTGGSRTIIHYRQLPEFDADTLVHSIDLNHFDWIHAEARHCMELKKFLAAVKQQRPDLPISIEFEKKRHDDERILFDLGEPMLFSHDYIQTRGTAQNPLQFLDRMSQQLPGRILICPWGDKGVYAIDQQGVLLHQPATHIEHVVDSVGAGDVFNAGIIHGFLLRQPLAEILRGACALAEKKCRHDGLNSLLADDSDLR